MTDWFTDLKHQALIHLPNMPTNYVENAILQSIRKFFRDTHLLTDDAYIDIQCNVDDYVIDLPDERTIIQAKELRANPNPARSPLVGRDWQVVPPAHGQHQRGWWVDLTRQVPTLTVIGCGLRSGQYALKYSWIPDTRYCELPHHFMGKYHDGLLHGVLSELFLIPTDGDTQNAQLAQFHLREFYRAIQNAQVEAVQNHTDRPLLMRGVGFI